MGRFSESVPVRAPIRAVWDVLADIGAIHLWNPGVKHSELLTPEFISTGARRRCDLGRGQYLDEEVTNFSPPHRMTIKVIRTSLPLRSAEIHFELGERGALTEVSISAAYAVRGSLLGCLIDPILVTPLYRRGMRKLLMGLKHYIEPA